MKAIQVKYMPVTETKPARLKVWAMDNKAQYVTDTDAPHKAANVYASNLGWLEYNSWTECSRGLVGGTLPNGDLCFVLVETPYNKELEG